MSKPVLALDRRVELGKGSSYTRVLELLRAGARAAGLDYVDWTAGEVPASVLWSPDPASAPNSPVRWVPTLHDITPLLPDGRPKWKRWRNSRRFRRSVGALAARASRLATVSDFARESIATECPELSERLRVVPNFAAGTFRPTEAAPGEDARVMAELGLPSETVLFVAALRRHKNWETLLRAWATLPAELRRAHPLVLAGDAHRARGVPEKLARSLGAERELHLPGRVPEYALPTLYRSAAVFAFPSIAEGFGLPPLEAMACGTSVLSSDRTSLPEVLGSACAYFDPRSASGLAELLRVVLSDPKRRAAMRLDGLTQAATWSAARTGAAMADIVDEVLSSPVAQ